MGIDVNIQRKILVVRKWFYCPLKPIIEENRNNFLFSSRGRLTTSGGFFVNSITVRAC